MLKIERQDKIMEILNKKGSVLVSELSELFNCSDETIRRDLKELEYSQALTRTYGGAFISEKHDKTYPSGIRKILFLEEKINISKEALKLINNNDFLFFDASTTCLQLVKEIINSKLSVTIVTNSLSIANLCGEIKNDIDLVFLGGVLRKHTESTSGVEALGQISYYFADKSFISPPKISVEIGLTDNHIYEANVRKRMIERSKEVIILADHTKFYENGNYSITSLKDIDLIITDKELETKWNKELAHSDVKLKIIK